MDCLPVFFSLECLSYDESLLNVGEVEIAVEFGIFI